MMTMDKTTAMQHREDILAQGYDLEIAWIEVIEEKVHVTYSPGYESILTKEQGVTYQRWSAIM
jgi:hypothetical protein